MHPKLYPNAHSVKDMEDAFKYFDTGIYSYLNFKI